MKLQLVTGHFCARRRNKVINIVLFNHRHRRRRRRRGECEK